MAEIVINNPLTIVASGNTTDNTLSIVGGGQPIRLTLKIRATVGTVNVAVNEAASAGIALLAASDDEIEFTIRNGVDIVHIQNAANPDAVAVAYCY